MKLDLVFFFFVATEEKWRMSPKINAQMLPLLFNTSANLMIVQLRANQFTIKVTHPYASIKKRRSLQPSKENTQLFKTKTKIYIYFYGRFLLSWIRIGNADPDPQHFFLHSLVLYR
jgi:hypothetical protein